MKKLHVVATHEWRVVFLAIAITVIIVTPNPVSFVRLAAAHSILRESDSLHRHIFYCEKLAMTFVLILGPVMYIYLRILYGSIIYNVGDRFSDHQIRLCINKYRHEHILCYNPRMIRCLFTDKNK